MSIKCQSWDFCEYKKGDDETEVKSVRMIDVSTHPDISFPQFNPPRAAHEVSGHALRFLTISYSPLTACAAPFI